MNIVLDIARIVIGAIILKQIIKQSTIFILRIIDDYKSGVYDKNKGEYNKDEFKKDK